jgi:ketosteroid isomerase-like protein
MKNISCAIAAVLLISTLSFGQADKKAAVGAPKAAGVEQTLMDLERRWVAVSLKNDAVALGEILADSWSSVSAEGKVESRAQTLEDVKKSKFTRSEVSDMKVRMINPNVAVVTGVWIGVGTSAAGQKVDTSERWTDVFVNEGGKWKCVASQSSTIKK